MLPSVRTGGVNEALGRSLKRSSSANGMLRSPEAARVKPTRSMPTAIATSDASDDRFEFLKLNSQIHLLESSDELLVFELPHCTGALAAYRSDAARERSPERLRLDRRRLPSCPLLEKEDRLKMLSYQNNTISRIENLDGLRLLVFLDLYGNKVERIENLDGVPNLRVLMLGKNQICHIQNLEGLTRLDVLDLHSNRITCIDRVEHLKELRALNLAGNSIQEVRNIENLVSLTELNLRRNLLRSLEGISANSSLQRVFASRNQLSTLEDLEPLGPLGRLSELALDGNPVCDLQAYQSYVFNLCPALEVHRHDKAQPEETQASTLNSSKNMFTETSPIDEAHRSLISSVLLASEGKHKEFGRTTTTSITGCNGDVCGLSFPSSSIQGEKCVAYGQEPFDQIVSALTENASTSGTSSRCIGGASLRLPGAESKRPPSATRILGGHVAPRNRPGSIQAAKNKGNANIVKARPSSAGTGGRMQEEPQMVDPSRVGAVGRQSGSRVPSAERRSSIQVHLNSNKVDEQGKAANSSSTQQKLLSSDDVLREIRSQWMQAEASGRTPSVRYGYVRREQANELAVYGRGLEALDKPEYQSVITSIHFNFITISSVLLDTSRLLKFQGLSSIVFARNQIFAFNQLEPLQQLPSLTSLNILDNPICETHSTLRMHVVRSLPRLQSFNNKEVTAAERQLASQIFEPFDQVSRAEALVRTSDVNIRSPQIPNLVEELTSHACAVDDKLRVVHTYFEAAVREAIREAWDDALAMSGTS